jgi:hypothetical protein
MRGGHNNIKCRSFYWLWLDVISEGDVAGTTADEDDVELNFR